MRVSENELYETETMAELCAKQGRPSEAIAIFQRLIDGHPSSSRRGRWEDRLVSLERAWGHAAGEEIEPAPIPLPSANGVAVAASDDSVTVAWSIEAQVPVPALELFLIQKTPSGVETNKRSFLLQAPAGRIALAVPALHSALAAVGSHEGERFIPLARSARD